MIEKKIDSKTRLYSKLWGLKKIILRGIKSKLSSNLRDQKVFNPK